MIFLLFLRTYFCRALDMALAEFLSMTEVYSSTMESSFCEMI